MYEEYKVYKHFHKKHQRYYAYLYPPKDSGLKRKTISWARYIMACHLGRELLPNEEVDHINDNKTDDKIENLQLLTKSDNIKKSARGRTKVCLICPECGKPFRKERRDTNLVRGQKEICCSVRCGRKRAAKTRKKK